MIAEHGLAARRALGQNFLLDLNLTGRIARGAGDLAGVDVLEIGPGPGGLTRALLAQGARRVVAVERDARCLPALAAVSARWSGRLEVVEGDALALDHAGLVGRPAVVVANLPYNIGTELLVRWLRGGGGGERGADDGAWPPWWSHLTLMFQREVAERIVAAPGSPHYGRLAVLAGWRTRSRILFDISPAAFTPPPKVTSAVVSIAPCEPVAEASLSALERVTAAAFGQRRKMLRQALRTLGRDPAPLLAAAGADPQARAETLDVPAFCALARALEAAER
ncbi:16S rRNA (adenine(1518)-N(6)/adenine(1519)-N(6))-dimethyltransferase RsmA [Rubrimonas cliftonensis]|uniref:Ribosomal RNA small subunit methyltransferase A n=1 Tax=Rubrimonas cliftonensis TaxID=89524 RepID=A0A1H3W046_9RHOB|nr:16S rRNA (adenine(1518)-N(6)/adenine(1519)-N(6))-dimethyltransferase RsmA [Rubrimonas cliftonensis]SDZ80429.1 dimethyladenosine transferase [Rubrimonas cliftonensis]